MTYLRKLCACTTVALAFPTALTLADGPPTSASLLKQHMDYFVRDGGKWTAENTSFEPGGTAPMRTGYEYRRAFHGAAVENTIYGIYEGEERRDHARAIFVWNTKAGKVEQFIYGAEGGVGHGFEDPKGDGIIEDEILWTNAQGIDVEMKDWVRIVGPDSFDNATYVKNFAGKWVVQPGSEVQFRRVSD